MILIIIRSPIIKHTNKTKMQEREHYQHRIFRKQLTNLSTQKNSKSLPRQNSFFSKIRRNKAVICLRQEKSQSKQRKLILDDENFHHDNFSLQSRMLHENSCEQNKGADFGHKQRQLNLTSRQQSDGVQNQSPLKQKRTKSLLLPKLGKISKSTSKSKYSKQKEENSIGATMLGSLSTTQILRKRQQKLKEQQMEKFIFLQNHIKNLKSTEHQDDGQFITVTDDKSCMMNQSFSPASSLQLRVSASNCSQKTSDKKIGYSQQKFRNLLKGQLSDSDYIQYNKKLLQKNVVNQKRYFQRYKNILQKQRAQIK